jgi:hypothetical protein
MAWGEVETESEFDDWYAGLTDRESATVDFYVDLLEEHGVQLGEPYTRQLSGKLRELRFHLGHDQVRVTYYIATGRRIILLTVFRKTRGQERREIERARRAMERCIAQGHTAEEGGL